MDDKKQKNNLTQKGFTIVEMLIVVAIIGMLATFGILKRKESVQRKQAEMTALEIKQFVELARDYALTGEVVGESVPSYFQFGIDADNYWIKALDNDHLEIEDWGKEESVGTNIGIDGDVIINYRVPHADCETGTGVSCEGVELKICGGDAGSCDKDSLNYVITINEQGAPFIE